MTRIQAMETKSDRDGAELELRARRAMVGIKCPSCGLVGYYRVNCPKCSPVVIDVLKDEWRPPTPEGERREKERREWEGTAEARIIMTEFKADSAVKTKTGTKDQSWFWRKPDEVWQYYDEVLPEAYDNEGQREVPFEIGKATVKEVRDYFMKSENRGVSHQNTFVPSKLRNIEDSDSKKPSHGDIKAGASNASLASALGNVMGGGYVPKSEAVPEGLYQGSVETVGTKPSILEEGTYLWDADSLHRSSKDGSERRGGGIKKSQGSPR